MSIHSVKGTSDAEKSKRFFVDFYEQWSAFFQPGRMNWIDFTIIRIQGEYARYSGRIEFEVRLLGLGLTFTYIFDTSFNDEMERRMADIDDPTKWLTVDEVLADLKKPQ